MGQGYLLIHTVCRSVLVINRNPTDQRESQSERDTVTKDTVHNVSRPPPLRVVLCGVVCGEEVGSVAASGLDEQPSAEDLVSIAINEWFRGPCCARITPKWRATTPLERKYRYT